MNFFRIETFGAECEGGYRICLLSRSTSEKKILRPKCSHLEMIDSVSILRSTPSAWNRGGESVPKL